MEATAKASVVTPATAAIRLLLVAPPAEGGIASHVISLLDGLRGNGYLLRVACEKPGPIASAAAERSVPVHPIICTAQGGPPKVALRALRLARVIADFRPHIVHTHSFGASMIGAAACAIARSARLLVTIHNYPPGTGTMAPSGAGRGWAFDRVIRRARHIITVSDALRRDLVSAYPEAMAKSSTIYNGVETQRPVSREPSKVRAEHGLPATGPLVGMVARLAPQKGILEYIRAARVVADAYPPAVFVLAGDGPLMQEAVGLRQELGLEQRLYLLGHVPQARDLIAALDLLVIASLSEGSSVVAMEAMSLGRPVVATTVGGVPEVVVGGETGILVPPGDPDALAAGVLDLLRDPERAAEMGERGRQRAVREFDLNDMIEKTKALYADIIAHAGRAGGKSP
ncbi:MAG: glycosyltransferase family 4 protein [Armatimonadota bacterium]